MKSMAREKLRQRWAILSGLIVAMGVPNMSLADETTRRRFLLNEDVISQVSTPADPEACNPQQVLSDLFLQIGPMAKVLPTENYYYFAFYRGGQSYSGSLRFDRDNRDKGTVQYVCYPTYVSWLEIDSHTGVQKELSAEDGVVVRKLDSLVYVIEFKGRAVTFHLNNLSQTPNIKKLGKEEKFSGRVFDESGIVFDLVYNQAKKTFYFFLSEGDVNDSFIKVKENLYIGKRTGFVFFEDTNLKRFILIAVHAEELHKNTWYDGPFDQLAENFYEQNGFWQQVYHAHPELEGKLTPGGTHLGLNVIFAIMPYRTYSSKKGLGFFDTCKRRHKDSIDLILCLTR